MRWLALLAALLAGCRTVEVPRPADGTTARLVDGKRVVGAWVSPYAYLHFMRGQLASLGGRSDEAVDELRRAIGSDGESTYLRTRLAEELMRLGRLDEARDELNGALALDPEFVEALVDLGRVHQQLGEVQRAEELLRRALRIDRQCEEAYLALAAMYSERGERQRSEEVFRSFGREVPASATAAYHVALVAWRHGDARLAEDRLRRALDLEPGMPEACRALGDVLRADGRLPTALRELTACFERTGDVEVADRLIEGQQASGDNEAAAILLDRLIEQPAAIERRLAIGWMLLGRHLGHRVHVLVEVLRQAGKGGEPAVALLWAATLEELGRAGEAAVELSRIPASAPELPRARLRLAAILRAQDRLPEAVATLEDGIRLLGDSPEADRLLAALAEAREAAGERPAAVRLLEAAAKARPSSETLLVALAEQRERSGQRDAAISAAQEFIRRQPDSPAALGYLGYAWARHGARLDEARGTVERAAWLRPSSGVLAGRLGWIHLLQGRLAEAERWMARAERLAGDDPEVQYHVGALHQTTGNRARAIDAYHRALLGRPGEPLRASIEAQLLLLDDDRLGTR